MSTGTRLARGEQPLSTDIQKCNFCGASREHLHRLTHTENVAQHSHHGTRYERVKCDECGGALVTKTHAQTRVTRPSRPTLIAEWWSVPERYVMVSCSSCGVIGGSFHLSDDCETLEALEANGSPCCGARVEFEDERFELGDGQ